MELQGTIRETCIMFAGMHAQNELDTLCKMTRKVSDIQSARNEKQNCSKTQKRAQQEIELG